MYHKVEMVLFAVVVALCTNAAEYDVAAYVWPAYQPEPRWADLGIFKAGKGEWQNVWEAVPKWKGRVRYRLSFRGYSLSPVRRVQTCAPKNLRSCLCRCL